MRSVESSLFLGCMSFGNPKWRDWVLDEEASQPLLELAWEMGIRQFDTANVYSGGESERIVGRFLRSHASRDEFYIATKLFYDTPDRLGKTGLGRENVIASAEGSLNRLGVDCIDLLQIHRWDPDVPIEETLEAFATLIDQGKIRAIGASNLSAWHLAKAQIAAAKMGFVGFTAIQPHYNLLYREEERDLIPLGQDQNMRIMPWSPLARGRLARPIGTDSIRSSQDDVADTLYADAGQEVIIALHQLAEEIGETPAAVALAWLISKGAAPLFGATKPRHIEQAVRAVSIDLTDEQIQRLEAPYRVLPVVELPYTAKNQAKTETLAQVAERA